MKLYSYTAQVVISMTNTDNSTTKSISANLKNDFKNGLEDSNIDLIDPFIIKESDNNLINDRIVVSLIFTVKDPIDSREELVKDIIRKSVNKYMESYDKVGSLKSVILSSL